MTNINEAIATIEGQALYELYVQGLVAYGVSPAYPLGVKVDGLPEVVQWKALTPHRKAFWQTLAQDFIKAAT